MLVDRRALVLATDGRYVEAARALEGVELLQARARHACLARRRASASWPASPVAFEADHVTVAGLRVALARTGVELVPTKGVVLGLRAVKDDDELDAIRARPRITDAAYERLAREPLVGRTEGEVAWWFEQTLREEGAEALPSTPIVAAGPNAALPHHHPGDRDDRAGRDGRRRRRRARGRLLLGLHAHVRDGPAPRASSQRAYALCRSAQENALAAVRAGRDGRRARRDRRARVIEAAGLEPVLHGLGHGVGMDVHELPVLRRRPTDTLVAGNVVTVEPGVYLAGRGRRPDRGSRRSSASDGPEVLTPFTKDLLTLD